MTLAEDWKGETSNFGTFAPGTLRIGNQGAVGCTVYRISYTKYYGRLKIYCPPIFSNISS